VSASSVSAGVSISPQDHALDDPDLLPPPDEVAAEIVESLETALDRFRSVAKALGEGPI
jgi:type I restriction enzyme M protein